MLYSQIQKIWVVLVLALSIILTGCIEQQATPEQIQISTPQQITPKQAQTSTIKLETTTIYYEPYPLAFYNAFYELGLPDITFEIKNPMDIPVTVKLTSEYQSYSNPAITTVTVMPGETKVINQTIPLIREKIEDVKTKTKFSLHYKIEYEKNGEWKVWDEETTMIDVYPMDTMVWAIKDSKGNLWPMYEYIAVFVTPKDTSVQYLLAVAKEYATDDLYRSYGLYRSLPGYQYPGDSIEEWRVYTALQVKAIYNTLQDAGMSYVNTPIAFGEDYVQKVKLPRESLETLSGNCIDGAVLFASAIEALGMHPYIIIVPGHAFVAWEVKPGSGIIDALETTLVGSSSFEEAWISGNLQLEEYWNVLQDDNPWNGIIVDIKTCRDAGILPME
ncbi:hypothetical protein CFE53_02915 [Methanofervidicoccus sp. A16]|uniref:hypothetical protein n=1 Tax=Methanofervidicoccus sp. A16 TaxID=2607662 RepID=UPI001188B238|nr:hypothetical protein [Methanofervidicoccus sp. A16]AXI25154.1 hypothetical protein CFE53_02915 [Methanofervidicoccus sp. A16]